MDAGKGKAIIGRLGEMSRKKKLMVAGVVLVCVVVVVHFATRKKPAPPPERVAVTAVKAVAKDMPVELREIGTIEGYRSVPIYAQITGQLVKIHFKEGQDVKKGQPLFTIDPNQYQAKVRQAEAQLARDEAQMKFARDEAKRYKYLYEKGAVALSTTKQAVRSPMRRSPSLSRTGPLCRMPAQPGPLFHIRSLRWAHGRLCRL